MVSFPIQPHVATARSSAALEGEALRETTKLFIAHVHPALTRQANCLAGGKPWLRDVLYQEGALSICHAVECEIPAKKDRQMFYKLERQQWSVNLSTTLNAPSDWDAYNDLSSSVAETQEVMQFRDDKRQAPQAAKA